MLSAVAAVLLVPPVNLAGLALLAVLLGRRRLAVAALGLLLLLALPLVAGSLLVALESGLSAVPPGAPAPQAIVILGGDVRAVAGGRTEPGALTLARLRAGAALARATHLPLLVTGGVVGDPDGPPVAAVMAASLAADFAAPARFVEPAAHDTWQNARLSAALLRAGGVGSVYVVTDAWHMRRALIAFGATGLAVTPAPLAPDRPPRLVLRSLVPRVGAWRESYFALHEWIGCAWYALRRDVG